MPPLYGSITWIDLLRLSKFTFMESRMQKWENYKYSFNKRTFLLNNGLYIAIILILLSLCIATLNHQCCAADLLTMF